MDVIILLSNFLVQDGNGIRTGRGMLGQISVVTF